MKKLLIVFHSKTGGTQQMAQAAAKGAAAEPDIAVNLLQAAEAGPQELLDADGYIFATPENLAMLSGMMKELPPVGALTRSPSRSLSAPMRKRLRRSSHRKSLANTISRVAKKSASR